MDKQELAQELFKFWCETEEHSPGGEEFWDLIVREVLFKRLSPVSLQEDIEEDIEALCQAYDRNREYHPDTGDARYPFIVDK